MATVRSNADQVASWISGVVEGFDFEVAGEDQNLGRDLAGLIAQGILDRSMPSAKDPDGGTWADNEPKYAVRKRKRFDADQPGFLTGQMLSLTSLTGNVLVASDRVEMTYGTGETPTRAANGTDLKDYEKRSTDREKGEWFTAGGRRFYGLDDTINASLNSRVAEALRDYIVKKNP